MSLLSHNDIVLAHAHRYLSNDSAVTSVNGDRLGSLRSPRGGRWSAVAGARTITLSDDAGVILTVKDPRSGVRRDTFIIVDAYDHQLATAYSSRMSLRGSLRVVLAEGNELDFQPTGSHVEVHGPDGVCGWASSIKAAPGLAHLLSKDDYYLLHWPADLSDEQRMAIVGGLIAHDLMTAKKNRLETLVDLLS